MAHTGGKSDDVGGVSGDVGVAGGVAGGPGVKRSSGFARLSPERLREVSSKGGKAAVAKGVGHRWTPETARIAGSKGGSIPRVPRATTPDSPVGPDAVGTDAPDGDS